MDRLRILIADDETAVSSGLSAMLQNLGHDVIACVSGGKEAVEQAKKLSPDLVIMDIRMDDMDGLEASKQILEQQMLPILIMTAFSDADSIRRADSIGVSGYLVKPFTQKLLQPALMLSWSRFKQMQALKQEIDNLHEKLKARKLIEQAKGLIMEREGITEADAFRRIQNMSRNQNIAMAKLAEAIIMTGKVLNTKRNPVTSSHGSAAAE